MNKMWKKVIIVSVSIIFIIESILLIKSFLRNNEALNTNNSLEEQLESVSKENSQITTDYLLTIIDDYELNILDKFKSNIDFQEVDIQKKLDYAYWYLKDKKDFSSGVSKVEVEKLLLKVFGDESVEHQNILCDCGKIMIYFDKNSGIYKFSSNHGGHESSSIINGADYNKVVSLTISKNQYKLIVNKLFINEDKVYSSASLDEDSLLFENETDLTQDDIIKQYEATYEEYQDKLVKYSYTFEKKNNKFILIKYEILD